MSVGVLGLWEKENETTREKKAEAPENFASPSLFPAHKIPYVAVDSRNEILAPLLHARNSPLTDGWLQTTSSYNNDNIMTGFDTSNM